MRKPHIYRGKKLDYCENVDGRLGFVCKTEIISPHQLSLDHIDGNSSNNTNSNFQTICSCCHAVKTDIFWDWLSVEEKKPIMIMFRNSIPVCLLTPEEIEEKYPIIKAEVNPFDNSAEPVRMVKTYEVRRRISQARNEKTDHKMNVGAIAEQLVKDGIYSKESDAKDAMQSIRQIDKDFKFYNIDGSEFKPVKIKTIKTVVKTDKVPPFKKAAKQSILQSTRDPQTELDRVEEQSNKNAMAYAMYLLGLI